MDLVIMAAGMGGRFGGLKQVEPINEFGEFLIDYSIYDAIRYGFDRVVFIIKKENLDLFRDTVGKRIEKKIKVEYVFQELDDLPEGIALPEGRVKPWGTVQAILAAKNVVDKNFAIINADDFYGRDAFKVVSDFLKTNTDNTYSVIEYNLGNTLSDVGSTKRGICQSEDGYLKKIGDAVIEREDEKLFATPLGSSQKFEVYNDTSVSMNMFGFTPSLFEKLEKAFANFLKENIEKNPLTCEYIISAFLDEDIKNGQKIKVIKTSAVWHGVTYKEDKEKVSKALSDLSQAGEYPFNLWK